MWPPHISARIKTEKGKKSSVFNCLRGGFVSGRKEESPHVSCNAYCLVVNINYWFEGSTEQPACNGLLVILR